MIKAGKVEIGMSEEAIKFFGATLISEKSMLSVTETVYKYKTFSGYTYCSLINSKLAGIRYLNI
ncbi:hypothetical protein [Psychromonas aquimarina]|uniref:hypothetical protein n=1 Tax=Psychromonas aquimarina TaxID=444919 RepID=UPI0012F9872B|nr:hypothetical protein [Psychromonas aquimarina]